MGLWSCSLNKKSQDKGLDSVLDRGKSLAALLHNQSDALNETLLLITNLKKKYRLSSEQLQDLLLHKEKYISVPIGLFRSKLGPLEALVRYLKDVHDFSFVRIARILNRDETTIWTTYHNSLRKPLIIDLDLHDIDTKKLKMTKENLIINVSHFSERLLSVLEVLCLYLRENYHLSYRMIGSLLERDERTVWTVVNRALKKIAHEQKNYQPNS